MIKVLMVGNSPTVKGGITTVINQYRNYDFYSHEIKLKFISTYKDNNNFIKIVFFVISFLRILLNFIFFRPQIVHIHMSYKGSFTRTYIIQSIATKFRIKSVIHLHGSEFKKWYDSVNQKKKRKIHKLLINCDRFIVLGNLWNDVIKEIEPKTKTLILNNSVKTKNEHASYRNQKNLLFLGVLIRRKGVHDLIEALKNIKDSNYRLLIAGSGDEELKLKKMAQEYNLNNIDFLGWIDSTKKEELLLNAQFMILPSYNEGLPMAILESMSYGVPVLSTNVGDIPTVIKNHSNGFLFNSGDISELTKLLKDIISMEENQWKNMSNQAKKTIESSYSEDKYFKKVVELYKKM